MEQTSVTFAVVSCLFFVQAVNSAIDESGCSVTKTCIQYPAGCKSTDPTCIFFTFNYNSISEMFDMELSGGTGGGGEYAAIGFTKVQKMEDSDVYFCTGTDLTTGVIQKQYAHPVMDKALPSEVSNVKAATTDGVAVCSFSRKKSLQRTVSNDAKQDFDLYTTAFYALFAIGDYKDKEPQFHTKYYGVPPSKVSFTLQGLSSECGKTLGCLQDPADCIPGSEGCQFLSWVYDKDAGKFDFRIVGRGAQPDWYQAFGFTRQAAMRDMDVYYCTKDKLGSSVIVRSSLPPQDVPIQPSEISEITYGVVEGAVSCSFTRVKTLSKNISTGPTEFDLTKNVYHIIWSTAPVAADGGMTQHQAHADRGLSPSTLDLTKFTTGSGGAVSTATKMARAHAILMMIAWMICANIGVVTARHYKPLWPDSTIQGKAVWFQVHRFMMVAALLLTSLGIILIFVAVDGFSSNAGAHPYIGLVVTGLTFYNPVLAFYRPAGNSPKRKYFNAAHWTVGSACRVLAVAAIFLGLDLPWLGVESFSTWIMVGFVVNQVVVEVVLEVWSALYGHVKQFSKYDLDEGDLKCVTPKYMMLSYLVLTNCGFCVILSYYVMN